MLRSSAGHNTVLLGKVVGSKFFGVVAETVARAKRPGMKVHDESMVSVGATRQLEY